MLPAFVSIKMFLRFLPVIEHGQYFVTSRSRDIIGFFDNYNFETNVRNLLAKMFFRCGEEETDSIRDLWVEYGRSAISFRLLL